MMKETQDKANKWLFDNKLSGATCADQSRTAVGYKDFTDDVGSSYSYTEPRQGTCNDCYFIAALISIALAASNKFQTFPNYKFYNTIGKSWSGSFSVNKRLSVNTNTNPSVNNLVYARTNSGKLWPCIYEKAYAMWKNNNLTNQEPNMSTICGGGNGLTALQEITGIAPVKNSMPPFLASGFAKYPAVAQTRASPTHTYTILKKSGTSYILYNPCGCTTETVTSTDFPNRFSEWGYITTS
jgi:hypothetical protein